MSFEPFVGEIQIMAFNFAPKNWAQCNGQLLPIAQNQALFSLLGTQYGGNGQTTFALPDLRGRTPIHAGNQVGTGIQYVQGQNGGAEAVALTIPEMPQHTHSLRANTSTAAIDNAALPVAGASLGQSTGFSRNAAFPVNIYASSLTSQTTLAPAVIATTGGSQPHENRQPYLALNICIALNGIFPSRA